MLIVISCASVPVGSKSLSQFSGPLRVGANYRILPEGFPQKRALVVGISDYQYANDLPSARPDAEDMESYLSCLGWNVISLYDSQATRQGILKELQVLVNQTDEDDYVLFYFSGHGANSTDYYPFDELDGLDEYICPYDAIVDNVSSYISDDFFTEWVRQIKSQHLAIILDSCASGGFVGVLAAHNFRDQHGNIVRSFKERDNAIILAACREYESAYDPGSEWSDGIQPIPNRGYNSYFTYYLLSGLVATGNLEQSFYIAQISTIVYDSSTPLIMDKYPGHYWFSPGPSLPFIRGYLYLNETYGPRLDLIIIKSWFYLDDLSRSWEEVYNLVEGSIDMADWPLTYETYEFLSGVPDVMCEAYLPFEAYKAFRNSWAGIYNLPGTGINSWGTFLTIHPNDSPSGGVLQYGVINHLYDFWFSPIYIEEYWPHEYYPSYPYPSYFDWQVLDKVYDTLIRFQERPEIIPWIPWVAYNWSIQPLDITVPNIELHNGSNITFWLRNDVYWHDGRPVTTHDIEYAWDLIKRHQLDQYERIWKKIVYVETDGDYVVNVWVNETAYSWNIYDILFDLVETGLLFPKHIWEKAEQTFNNLTEFHPWEYTYKEWTGNDPPEEHPFLTALIGCGPYIYSSESSPESGYIVLWANNYYFKKRNIINGFIQASHRVNPDSQLSYSVTLQNGISKTTEIPIEVRLDDDTIYYGTVVLNGLELINLGPYQTSSLPAGLHELELYVNSTRIYTHKIYSTIPEDINLDFAVNFIDAIILGAAFGSIPGDANWDPRADILKDYVINFIDAIKLGAVFGWLTM